LWTVESSTNENVEELKFMTYLKYRSLSLKEREKEGEAIATL
jgi:hypothetical protein